MLAVALTCRIVVSQSVFSTPPQNKAIDSVQDASGYIYKDKHEDYIHREYTDKITWDVDVESFIRAIFCFGWEHVSPIPYRMKGASAREAEHYSLVGANIKAYRNSSERGSYAPFNLIANGLLEQLYGPADEGRRGTRQADGDDERCNKRRKDIEKRWTETGRKRTARAYRGYFITHDCEAISNFKSRDKPDGTYGVARGKPVWEWELVPIEVGKSKESIKRALRDVFVRCEDGTFSISVRRVLLYFLSPADAFTLAGKSPHSDEA